MPVEKVEPSEMYVEYAVKPPALTKRPLMGIVGPGVTMGMCVELLLSMDENMELSWLGFSVGVSDANGLASVLDPAGFVSEIPTAILCRIAVSTPAAALVEFADAFR